MFLEFIPVSDFGLPQTADLMTRGFADYLVKISATEAVLWSMARADSVGFAESRVVRLNGEPVAAALIARRGWASRLAGMAVVPAARGKGVGRALVEKLLEEARTREDHQLVLEVIEQNTAAMRLYEATGFQRVRRLVGFAGPAPGGLAPVPELAAVDLRAVASALTREQSVNWPWQISGETIAQLAPPAAGYMLDGAWLALSNTAGPAVSIRALVVEGVTHREDRAARLLRAAMARHPAREWRISALWPEELGGWMLGAGLARQAMSQWQMEQGL
ncbi:MAG: GNAT family N-acetyltransferase [Phycisphaerae bacterium]|jgi:ribosomal protein S18 acetylase RimI-like enzyme